MRKAYTVVDQANGALHTMSVLEAFQADLLEDINVDKRVPQDEVLELRSATDHAFWAP